MAAFEGIAEEELGLFIDLYELTMAQAYLAEKMAGRAVFTLHFRSLPPERQFVLACGQHYAALLVTSLRFTREQVDRLAQLDLFTDAFLDWLTTFRFSGDIRVVPEGTLVFPHEPLLEVDAPIIEGQLLETLLMNYVSTETVLASKAVRLVMAAKGRPIVDFGMRRMHGIDAALRGVRAYRTAGIQATSNVLGSFRYGLPASGTMAHSFIQAYESETDALRSYARLYPGTTLLVDTYDTLAGVDKVISLVRDEGLKVGAIRLDSGNLEALAHAARDKLNEAGLTDMRIVASTSLDEWSIQALVDGGAPVDGFGVGTRLGVAEGAPALNFAYKLTEYAGAPRLKVSSGKKLLPGPKQVWRFRDSNGRYDHDEITCSDEQRNAEPLLSTVVENGLQRGVAPDLETDSASVQRALKDLPASLHSLSEAAEPYQVVISPRLDALYRHTVSSVTGGGSG